MHLQEMKKSGDEIRHGLIWVFLGCGFECSLFSSHPGSFYLTDRQTESPQDRELDFFVNIIFFWFSFLLHLFFSNHALLFVTNLSLTVPPYWVRAAVFFPPKFFHWIFTFVKKNRQKINKEINLKDHHVSTHCSSK